MIMVFTGDERYREIKEEIMKLVTEGREVTMCTFADRMEKRGFELGEKRGFELGEKSGFELGEKKGLELGEKRGFELGEKSGIAKVAENM